MTGRTSSAMERALKRWQEGMKAGDINRIAYECKVSPSGLYKALCNLGRLTRTPRVQRS